MNNVFKILLLIPVPFLFIPAFAFLFQPLNSVYLFFFLFLYLAIGLSVVFSPNKNIANFIKMCKATPLKYYMLILLLMSVNALFLSVAGSAKIGQSIRSIIMQIFLFVMPIIFYFTSVINQRIGFSNFIKIFTILFWINLLIVFVAYIGQLLDISAINNFFDMVANLRFINTENAGIGTLDEKSNYTAFGMPRLDNFFEEPGHYAQFLFLFLPFVYSVGGSKIKLLKNYIANSIVLKTIVPFTWISIILTLSPMFLVFSILISLIYYKDIMIKAFIKYNVYIIAVTTISIIVFFLLLYIGDVDISQTYISRIFNIFTDVKSVEDLIYVDGSLASRIVCYINSFCIFLKHPFLGVGMGNLGYVMYEQYLNSPVPLTPELIVTTPILMITKGTPLILRGFICKCFTNVLITSWL